jgi:hypothetical protein
MQAALTELRNIDSDSKEYPALLERITSNFGAYNIYLTGIIRLKLLLIRTYLLFSSQISFMMMVRYGVHQNQ